MLCGGESQNHRIVWVGREFQRALRLSEIYMGMTMNVFVWKKITPCSFTRSQNEFTSCISQITRPVHFDHNYRLKKSKNSLLKNYLFNDSICTVNLFLMFSYYLFCFRFSMEIIGTEF